MLKKMLEDPVGAVEVKFSALGLICSLAKSGMCWTRNTAAESSQTYLTVDSYIGWTEIRWRPINGAYCEATLTYNSGFFSVKIKAEKDVLVCSGVGITETKAIYVRSFTNQSYIVRFLSIPVCSAGVTEELNSFNIKESLNKLTDDKSEKLATQASSILAILEETS